MNSALSHLRRVVGVIAMLSLAGFHAGFLWQRLADDSIAEPRVLARWLASALLLCGLVLVRRTFSPRWHVLLVFWLLVALLHAGVPAGDDLLDARDSHLALIAQTGLAALSGGLLLAALLVTPGGRERRVLFLLPARESLFWNALTVSADGTRAPPAH
ncbi:MAG: hypothetical protein ACXW29_01520 [Thermoanaerobaculia bacterium]